MINVSLIPAQTICTQYNIELAFVDELHQVGLIELQMEEERTFLPASQLAVLEQILRLHNELHLNLEGVDVVLNMLAKEKQLRHEITTLQNRLRRYENI